MQTATRWERQLCRARLEHGCFDVSFSDGAAVEAPGAGLGSEVQVWASSSEHRMPCRLSRAFTTRGRPILARWTLSPSVADRLLGAVCAACSLTRTATRDQSNVA